MPPKGKQVKSDAEPKKAAVKKEVVKGKKVAKLKPSLTPGTICIILSGRFRGRRCVFLKQLPSGLLLVTGPYAVNGVPLRRVNQRYVIGTSTKVDVGKANVAKFDDKYFAVEKEKKKAKTEEGFFAQESKKPEIADSRKSDQKAADKDIVPAIEKVPELKKYLKARFSLTNTTYPHMLKF